MLTMFLLDSSANHLRLGYILVPKIVEAFGNIKFIDIISTNVALSGVSFIQCKKPSNATRIFIQCSRGYIFQLKDHNFQK